jgi:hypothetical protein
MRNIEEHLSIQASGMLGRREFNRYAVGRDSDGYRVLTETQNDDTFGSQAGLRWYAASVLNDLVFQIQATQSNNYGSSNHIRSVSWTAGMNPMPALTFQMMFRLFKKQYDVNPLTIPEFQLGFNDEDGQDLLSAKTTWDVVRSWNISFTFNRLRTESMIPARYYIKQVLSLQLQRSF